MIRPVLYALLIVACSGVAYSAVRPLTWLKGRNSKAVPPPSQSRVAYHGSAPLSSQGRLYFPTDRNSAAPERTRTKVVKTSR